MLNQFKEFIFSIGLTDAIDIAIIATLIYLLLVWFARARARFMLVGMVIVGLIYVLARVFGLYLTTLVFQAFFAISLIMIVVIFQDDFRHFFESVALWGISKRRRRKERVSFGKETDILCSGVANLSRKHIGGLIVVRGIDPLDRYIEAGVHLDALLNEILLESIFDPHVPSHDGALTIDGMRVTMFGCHLPLSTNIQEIGHLGTRHAAALGLTERTDALCIIVSEERGTVSVAEGGRIKRLGDVTDLRAVLGNFYQKCFPEKKKPTSAYFLRGHLVEKAVAVILALSLWFVFGHRTEIVRRDFVVPIEYRNLAPDRIIEEAEPKDVSVTLSGSERAFTLLIPQELKLSLDMSGVKDGENTLALSRDLIRLPSGLSLVKMEPDDIDLKVYTMVQMSVPVDLKTKGSLPAGLVLRNIKVEPKEVPVTASGALKKETIYVSTDPVDLDSVKETKTINLKLRVSPDGVRFPNDKQPDVKVTISVEKKEGGAKEVI